MVTTGVGLELNLPPDDGLAGVTRGVVNTGNDSAGDDGRCVGLCLGGLDAGLLD